MLQSMRTAPLKSARTRLAPRKSTRTRIALLKFDAWRFAPLSEESMIMAREKFVRVREALPILGSLKLT